MFEAYSPLGNPGSPFLAEDAPRILNDAVIMEIAEKHKASVAQVRYFPVVFVAQALYSRHITFVLYVFLFTSHLEQYSRYLVHTYYLYAHNTHTCTYEMIRYAFCFKYNVGQ